MRMQMMQQQQQQQGMPRPPPPDYKTPMMSSGVASQPGNTMMNQQQSHHMMPANQQQQNYAPAAIRPGIRPSMVPNPVAQQPVAVGRPSPNGATSPMLQQQQQQRGMVNYPQQGQQPMMGKIYLIKSHR